jgi:hypothetical protein
MELKELKELLVLLEPLVSLFKEHKELKDHRELKELKEFKELKELRELKDLVEPAHLEPLVYRELKELKGVWARVAILVSKAVVETPPHTLVQIQTFICPYQTLSSKSHVILAHIMFLHTLVMLNNE